MKFDNPIAVGESHDISFLPEEGTVRSLELDERTERRLLIDLYKMMYYHFEFAQRFHGVDLSGGLSSDEIDGAEGTSTDDLQRFEVIEVNSLITDLSRASMN